MVFNIHNQNAGVVNNVDGVQHVHGGQHVYAPQITDLRQAVHKLRSAVEASELSDNKAVCEYLNALDSEVRRSKPDPARVGGPLKKITEIAAAAGALAGLVGPIQTVVAWLGFLGQPIAKLLG